MESNSHRAIAIIGMAGRFPNAPDIHAFWRNLEQGHESLVTFSKEELLESGVPPDILARPDFVRRGIIVEDADHFDATFFGFNPREAELIDPQHRLLLECAWEAMEDAGYGAGDRKNVGVYAGASINTYIVNLLTNPDLVERAGPYQVMVASDKDFLASRIGYKLDLRGPCVAVQTACSTSLVAVHVACQALLAGECAMALAGGVALHFPQKTGYLYQEGMIFSPDGHCRPFDADGRGICNGEGAGMVVLKPLNDALRDGDSIRGVILGTAINNDGADKIGYTAPSVEGQVNALIAALRAADIDPTTVGYVEAHGTATPLGDVIEFAGLSKVYGSGPDPCVIGSVKSNIGHLDTAAGVAGLMKAVLAMQHRSIPPTLHFRRANPQLDWRSSRFRINTVTEEWPEGSTPRRAAVSSFGIGGTNAHAVLEEAPQEEESRTLWPEQLVVVSAVTASALEESLRRLASHVEVHPDLSLPDLCYTLQAGRRRFPHRRALVCPSVANLRTALKEPLPKEFAGAVQSAIDRPVAFLFTGQGAQYHGMGRDLYTFQPTFRRWFDYCTDGLRAELGLDLRELLYAAQPSPELNDTRMAQPALFALEYALAQMWMRFGLRPVGMIGHSLGEFVAACIAGVFTLDDALRIVALRGRIMQSMPRGSMLSVGLGEDELQPRLSGLLCIAAVNGRSITSVSGPVEEIAGFQRQLESQSIACTRLHTSHAFHSSMMEPAMAPFRDFLSGIALKRPTIPFVSNLTGRWITDEEAVDPDYWSWHLREKVQFSKGVRELAGSGEPLLLEVGPGHALTSLARESLPSGASADAISTLPIAKDPQPASRSVLNAVASLWLRGAPIDWSGVHEEEVLHRTSLPTYPFERSRYYVKPGALAAPAAVPSGSERLALDDWFYVPSWKRSVAIRPDVGEMSHGPWLIFADSSGLADALARTLSARGESFVQVRTGSGFSRDAEGTYVLDPGQMEQYRDLISDLVHRGSAPRSILWGWSLQSGRDSFHNLISLAQAFGEVGYNDPVDLIVVSERLYRVLGDEEVEPDQALRLGPCRTIPLEYPNITCRNIDLCAADGWETAAELLCDEPGVRNPLHGLAFRRGFRWEQFFEPVQLPPADDRIRAGGVYLITGGMGGIGLTLARYFASVQAKIALIGRRKLPERHTWQTWMESHPADDDLSTRMREVMALEEMGAEVLALTADVGNPNEMRAAIDAIHASFGPIEGIVHAAGIAGGGLIQAKSVDASKSVLAPKVDGTRTLQSLAAHDPLQFFVLCSSVNAVLGMVGGVDYTAANAWLDACAVAANTRESAVMMSIDWDAWQEVGMAVNTQVPREMQAARQASLQSAIRPLEGVEVFRRALGAGLPQLSVVTHDVLRRAQSSPTLSDALSLSSEKAASAAATGETHARPDLATPFCAPETNVERKIAEIWQQALGQSQIGLDDNFFELGGHSLAATSILSRVRNAFSVTLPLRVIFETPTVRSLSEHVETLLWNVSQSTEPEDAADREEVEF